MLDQIILWKTQNNGGNSSLPDKNADAFPAIPVNLWF